MTSESDSRKGTERGLYEKYDVRKDGEPVEGCFVLEPEDDSAAREALIRYAEETDDEELAADLREWVIDLCTQGDGESGGVSVGTEGCDHLPIKDLDSQSYDVGDEIDCGDCGKTFVVQFNGYQNRRVFVAEDVAEAGTDGGRSE